MRYRRSVTIEPFRPSALKKLGIDPKTIPQHVAVIMDGNGRWAEQRNLPRTEGHLKGEEALFECVEGALELGISWLTVFGFSTENWNRPKNEVQFLINFNRETIRKRRDELHERNVKIEFIGREDWRMPKGLLRDMNDARNLTKQNSAMTFTIAFNYGGRAELVDAFRAMEKDGISSKQITEKKITQYLYGKDMPEPDLIIRTSGEQRISNFLLWQSAYSEFLFLDTFWPDFTRESLYQAIAEYQIRSRRFGAL
ncbi:MAG TPA: di-trans,poly-cis-decaprenylcistransferase [Acidimicrobiaceae bacterium]|jgi:undecaprenyl diphosphate synthase|nr:di-trans,poly-cis-decaprenylcistransferase [Acidimicrobiaceae bacterium]